YKAADYSIQNFCVIPKHFFTPGLIEKRKPLMPPAKRAGWVGCNILLRDIPQSGKIFYIQNGQVLSKENVLSDWRRTAWLRQEPDYETKGWLMDVMKCIDRLGQSEFTLQQLYAFENELTLLHPKNRHIKDKIRQQLQVLRDKGYLEFVSSGQY